MPRIRDLPPLIFHLDEHEDPGFDAEVRTNLERYRQPLPPERRVLLDRYELADVAMGVVGVGSVGTTCAVGATERTRSRRTDRRAARRQAKGKLRERLI